MMDVGGGGGGVEGYEAPWAALGRLESPRLGESSHENVNPMETDGGLKPCLGLIRHELLRKIPEDPMRVQKVFTCQLTNRSFHKTLRLQRRWCSPLLFTARASWESKKKSRSFTQDLFKGRVCVRKCKESKGATRNFSAITPKTGWDAFKCPGRRPINDTPPQKYASPSDTHDSSWVALAFH